MLLSQCDKCHQWDLVHAPFGRVGGGCPKNFFRFHESDKLGGKFITSGQKKTLSQSQLKNLAYAPGVFDLRYFPIRVASILT